MHEVGLYFRVALEVGSAPMRATATFSSAEPGLEFKWFERRSLSGMGLRPSFLILALAEAELEFRHVVEHQSAGT